MVLYIYTDGACKSNGSQNSVAGYGIFFSENDARNISKKLDGYATNNIAELTAIVHAMEIVQFDEEDKIIILTDSKYAMLCCTSYGEKCIRNNWNNPNHKSKPIPNIDLVKRAFLLAQTYKDRLKFQYIKAHTNLLDQHSIGNKNADLLANLALKN